MTMCFHDSLDGIASSCRRTSLFRLELVWDGAAAVFLGLPEREGFWPAPVATSIAENKNRIDTVRTALCRRAFKVDNIVVALKIAESRPQYDEDEMLDVERATADTLRKS